jgi:hypothetical protein
MEVLVQIFKAFDDGAAPHGGGGVRCVDLRTVDDDGVAPHDGGDVGCMVLGTEVEDGVNCFTRSC